MNTVNEDSAVNWLFLDLNSFFASCEQQARPELRGKPVAVVQMITDSTCAIAASYEAKAYGVKTGTMIWEAKKMCPGLILVKARHPLYVDIHHRVIAAVDTCLPVTKVASIDELACRLTGSQRNVAVARAMAFKVKNAIRSQVGERLTCSIGLAPSLFLGKVGSDMQKPDGLVVITRKDLPHILHPLKLTAIYGIGRRMEQRMHQMGIFSVAELMEAPRAKLRRVWGGIYGTLYHELLHGADLQFPSSPYTRSMSHEHVLEPQLRTIDGARQFSLHLLAKAGERLRNKGYFCRRLGLSIAWKDWSRWWNETGFAETQNTDYLLARLAQLWERVPENVPKKVGVVLLGLVPGTAHQPDLFSTDPRRRKLSPVIDTINRRYGRGTITFGQPAPEIKRFTGHAAFQRVPEKWEF